MESEIKSEIVGSNALEKNPKPEKEDMKKNSLVYRIEYSKR